MSDNKTVPNAAAILNNARGKNDAPYSIEYWNAAIEAMHEHTRLHFEAMLNGRIEKEKDIVGVAPASEYKDGYLQAMTNVTAIIADYISKLK